MSKYIIDVNDEAYDPNNLTDYYLYKLDGPLILCRDCMFYDELIGRCVNFDDETVSEDSFCSEAEPKEANK